MPSHWKAIFVCLFLSFALFFLVHELLTRDIKSLRRRIQALETSVHEMEHNK